MKKMHILMYFLTFISVVASIYTVPVDITGEHALLIIQICEIVLTKTNL